jgi:hypothetical protein
MSKKLPRRQVAQTPSAPIMTAQDGTIIGRMDDLQKAFTDMAQTYDLSQRGQAFIQAAMLGIKDQNAGQFGPGAPNLPQDPEQQPRQFAYTPGVNLTWTPRAGYGLMDYGTLRALSFASKEIRLNIQMVKRTVRGLGHEITQQKKTVESFGQAYQATPPNYDDVQAFWTTPDGFHDFDDWVDLILEDALTVGTAAIYKTPDPSLDRCAQPIDATTWRILTDMAGRVPAHPMPAFIQTTYGRPSFWCSRKHLTYSPLNPTINNPYGYSPEEFIIQSIVQGIKRDASRTGAFTEGNVPAAFVGLPTSWSPQQIKDFTDWFNALVTGDVNRMNKIMFIPHDGQGIPVSPFSAIDQNATGLDEWLLKNAAWTYGNSPAEFGLTSGQGLGGKGVMDAGENSQQRGSIAVYTRWISRIVESISRDYLDAPWVKSTWQGLAPTEDALKDAQVETTRINSGVWSVAFVQDKLGYDRKKYGQEAPAAQAPQGPTLPGATPGKNPTQDPDQAPNGPQDVSGQAGAPEFRPTRPPAQLPPEFGKVAARAAEADLLAWRDKARFSLGKGLAQPAFKTDCIPTDLVEGLARSLGAPRLDRQDIDNAFSAALNIVRSPNFVRLYAEQTLMKYTRQPEPLEKTKRRRMIDDVLSAMEALEALETGA